MKNIYTSVTELIGKTPLLEAVRLEQRENLKAKLLLKLEYFNPAGSMKDRVAKQMIEDAEERGLIKEGAVIIEPTSGNTGIGIAAIAAAKGYKAVLTMPETMSVERRKLLLAYGAEIVLTDGKAGMGGAIKKADELAAAMDNAIVLGQFVNPSNPMAHELTTGPEIWRDTDGEADMLVAGVGTGGTITGTGRYLKEKKPEIKVVAVEPQDSAVLSEGAAGPHGLQGIGAGFIPEILDMDIIDNVVCVKEEEAYAAVRQLAESEGILVGITSGAALHAAVIEAKKPENEGKTIVAVLPDTGERYLSTPLFE